ncbi:MAG: phosphatidate cytidylyltransferase [Clostridia bacterium]|nr:phosphatidate cytidylyltransferase [Clostridia bacterium]
MKKRILTGVIGIVLLSPFIVFSHTWALVALMLLFSITGVYEMLKCTGALKNMVIAIPSFIVTAAAQILTKVTWFGGDKYTSAMLLVYTAYAVLLMMGAVFSKGKIKIADAAISAVTTTYISFGFSSLILLRDREFGMVLFILALLIPWVSDAMAYFVGVFFGKHKLIPEVSPKKTVEGAVGGIVGVCVATVIFGLIMQFGFNKIPNYILLMALAFVGGLLGMCGDLIASLIKREYGIKDYGNLFPGHGGVMDRFDSTIAVSSFMYVICWIFSASYLFKSW